MKFLADVYCHFSRSIDDWWFHPLLIFSSGPHHKFIVQFCLVCWDKFIGLFSKMWIFHGLKVNSKLTYTLYWCERCRLTMRDTSTHELISLHRKQKSIRRCNLINSTMEYDKASSFLNCIHWNACGMFMKCKIVQYKMQICWWKSQICSIFLLLFLHRLLALDRPPSNAFEFHHVVAICLNPKNLAAFPLVHTQSVYTLNIYGVRGCSNKIHEESFTMQMSPHNQKALPTI